MMLVWRQEVDSSGHLTSPSQVDDDLLEFHQVVVTQDSTEYWILWRM